MYIAEYHSFGIVIEWLNCIKVATHGLGLGIFNNLRKRDFYSSFSLTLLEAYENFSLLRRRT